MTVVVDEQEINQGAFIHKGKLHGLKNVMSVADIQKIRLSELAKYISTHNNFVSSVREYRLTNFSGFMCTNIFTSFEAGSLVFEQCNEQLTNVVNYSKTFISCLQHNMVCVYATIDVQCIECIKNGNMCISMVVFHTLWDMGSSHKKTTNLRSQIDLSSCDSDFLSSTMFTIGFGGLHLAKACTNSMRNHILYVQGMHYGLNIFRAVKLVSDLLDNIKQAVFVGKDHQSDLLSFLTSCYLVQEALDKLEWYELTRVPEPVLGYTSNAKTQKDIIFPIALSTNRN